MESNGNVKSFTGDIFLTQLPKGDLELLGPMTRNRPDVVAHYLASIIESSDDAILSKDLNSIIRSLNKGAERLFGYAAEEALGKPITILIPHDRQDEEPVILERIKRGERVDHYETVRQRKDGSLIEVSLTVSPIMTAEGQIIGASKIARDISERKRAHDRQLFLIRELEHRTKNLFAVFHAIVNRSLVEPHTLAEAKEILNGRLQALAQAHAMLADAAWKGAPLTDIIRQQLAVFAENLSISGCDLDVNTPAAQHFALAVHELATNAAKYGALSVAHGRVSVKCNVERANSPSTFSFVWKESGGPPVVPPTQKGFGSSILLNAAKQFGPHVTLNYEPDGLRYEVRFPLRTVEASTEMAPK